MVDKNLHNRQKFKEIIAVIIKKYRLKKGKSISLISAEIGMTKSMWADTEKALKDPQFSTVYRMCEALDISPVDFCMELIKKLPDDFSLTE